MAKAGLDLAELYREYYPKVYSFFFVKLRHKENAEDLAGRTFLKITEHLQTYDPEKSKLCTWIRRISENVLIDFYRTQKGALSLDDAKLGAGAMPSVSFEEQYKQIINPLRKELSAALWQLSERERILVCHKYLLGWSYHEIARKFQINESTLATVLQRAKEKLRAKMSALNF